MLGSNKHTTKTVSVVKIPLSSIIPRNIYIIVWKFKYDSTYSNGLGQTLRMLLKS